MRPGVHRLGKVYSARGEAVRLYAVTCDFPQCGKVHQVSCQRVSNDGPNSTGTVSELLGNVGI